LWFRKGYDRTAFIAAAYMIKQYGVTVAKALDVIETARPGVSISKSYMTALEEWSRRNTLGELLCVDCIANASKSGSSSESITAEAKSKRDVDASRPHYSRFCDFVKQQQIQHEQMLKEKEQESGITNDAAASAAAVAAAATAVAAADAAAAAAAGEEEEEDDDEDGTVKKKFEKSEEEEEEELRQKRQQDLAAEAAEREKEQMLVTLGEPSLYLQKILLARHLESGWSGLLDLHLCGRRLGDAMLESLFRGLASAGVLPHLRVLDLKSNGIGCRGIVAVVEAFYSIFNTGSGFLSSPAELTELTVLDVSCNNIHYQGGKALARLISENTSLTSVDVSSNPIGDEGIASILAVLAPEAEQFMEESGVQKSKKDYAFNKTITSLNVSSTGLGHDSSDSLIETFRKNNTLTSLNLDFNHNLKPKDLKHITNALRSYNRSLLRLSLADNELTIQSMGYLGRIFDSPFLPLMRLDLSRTGLTATHMGHLARSLQQARFLSYLTLSSDLSVDGGSDYLCIIIRGKVNEYTGDHWPPLQNLDISFCNLTEQGSKDVLEAISTRPTIKTLNISYNTIGENVEALRSYLDACKFLELRMNGCNIQSKGASCLFQLLAETSVGHLGHSLRALYLAENNIHDRTSVDINFCLNRNMTLEELDLGFNKFTKDSHEALKAAISVVSTSSLEKKVAGLNVNMIGNNCDPYMLDAPGLARSKINFRFGIQSSLQDDQNAGYTHIPMDSRRHHFLRKITKSRGEEETGKSMWPINSAAL